MSSHTIVLNDKEINLSIEEELYLPNSEYINETIDYFISTEGAIKGSFEFSDVLQNENKPFVKISWNIVEIVEKERIFQNKKELALALLNGEDWRVKDSSSNENPKYCFFDEKEDVFVESKTPFKYGSRGASDNHELDGFWSCADGVIVWEKVNN